MSRLPSIADDDVSDADRPLLERGQNLFRILLHNPEPARRFFDFNLGLREGPLDPKLRELAILQIGHSTGVVYEYGHHLKIALAAGLSDAEIRAVAKDSAGKETDLSPVQKAVLRAARQLTEGMDISDRTFADLQEHLPRDSLVDLVLIASIYTGIAKILNVFRVEIEDDYQDLLKLFPINGVVS